MKFALSMLAMIALTATAAADPILLGSPHTSAITFDSDGVFNYMTDVENTHVATQTTDNSGLGYDVDLYFYDASGAYLGGCYEDIDEDCDVPEGAATMEVAAFIGYDLDVEIVWSE